MNSSVRFELGKKPVSDTNGDHQKQITQIFIQNIGLHYQLGCYFSEVYLL